MTQEQKQLLLKDLCARLPYKPHCRVFKLNEDIKENDDILYGVIGDNVVTLKSDKDECLMYYQIKPYLRPMSSMSKAERAQLEFAQDLDTRDAAEISISHVLEFFLEHHFDYRGLIPMGLALEASEGMYFQQKSDDALKKDVAKKLIDVLIYDNDYVNRMTPLDESRHYGGWIDYVAKSVTFPDSDKEWWDKEDRIDIFAVGDYDDKEDMIKNYPSLRELDTVLNEYYDYLNEEFKI